MATADVNKFKPISKGGWEGGLSEDKGKGKQPAPKKRGRPKGKKSKKKDKKRNTTLSDNRAAAMRSQKARKKYFRDLARNWTTSAKIEKVREILRTIQE